MLRKSVVLLAMLLSGVAMQSFALGLGTANVESALNQPLRVRIEILQLGDTRLEDVNVQLASVDDFQRFNIDRIGFLSNIRFAYETSTQGNWVVLTTNQIVREPYLSFILETRWPSGRLLSEHTILLDLPVFTDGNNSSTRSSVRQPVSPVLQPPASTPAPASRVTPAVTPAQPAVREEPVSTPQVPVSDSSDSSDSSEPPAMPESSAVEEQDSSAPSLVDRSDDQVDRKSVV